MADSYLNATITKCKKINTSDVISLLIGVHFVKINDKKLSKQYNIKNYPALTYFRNKEPIFYEGIPPFINPYTHSVSSGLVYTVS